MFRQAWAAARRLSNSRTCRFRKDRWLRLSNQKRLRRVNTLVVVRSEQTNMKRIGFIGLGVMGGGIAGTLLKAGCDLTVWSRNPDQGKPLVKQGAKAAPTITAAVK